MPQSQQQESLNSYDAEYRLLSIFCQHKESLGYLSDKIIPEFFTDINKILFVAIMELYQTGFSIDTITIQHILKKLPNGNRVPDSLVIGLFKQVDLDKIEAYVSIVSENYKTRSYQSMVVEVSRAIAERKSSSILSEIVQKYSSNSDLGMSRPKNIDIVANDYALSLQEGILDGCSFDKKLLKFHIEELDRHDKMRPGNVYTYAGRPSQGKTSAMIQTAYHNAFDDKKRVVVFSLEMTKDELLEKVYCYHNKIDSDTWLKMPPHTKLKEIQMFTAFLVANHIEFIIDDECSNIATISTRAKALNSEKHVDLFCLDYIQLVDCSLVNRNKSDEIEMIMNVTKKDIATKNKSCVIALSQMGKKIEQENYRLPILADLLNGGAIEATSTSVYFLHSVPTVVRHYFDEDGHIPNNGETLFIAQKARYGKKGILKTWFAGGMNKFVTTQDELLKTQEEVKTRCQHFLTK